MNKENEQEDIFQPESSHHNNLSIESGFDEIAID